jgi:quinoprotein glucose dehydrogenase
MKPVLAAALVAGFAALLCSQTAELSSKEWPTYGHDSGGMRFSPLTEITPENVGQLKVAWVYHMKPAHQSAMSPSPRRPVEGLGPECRQVDAAAADVEAAPASARAPLRLSSSAA